jgi:hypothetical protein
VDDERFDQLARTLGILRTRRGVLSTTGLFGAVVVLATTGLDTTEAKKKRKRNQKKCTKRRAYDRCGRGKQCCSKQCCTRRGSSNPRPSICGRQGIRCCSIVAGGGWCDNGDTCCPPDWLNPNGACCSAKYPNCCGDELPNSCCPKGYPVCCPPAPGKEWDRNGDGYCCASGYRCCSSGCCSSGIWRSLTLDQPAVVRGVKSAKRVPREG